MRDRRRIGRSGVGRGGPLVRRPTPDVRRFLPALILLLLLIGCAASEMYLTDNTLHRPIDEARRILLLGTRVRLGAGESPSTPDLAARFLPDLLPQVDRVLEQRLAKTGIYNLLQVSQLSPELRELLDTAGPELPLDRLPAVSGQLQADHIVWAEVIAYFEKQSPDLPHLEEVPQAGNPGQTARVWRKTTRDELLVVVRLYIADGRLGKVIWNKDLEGLDIIEVSTELDWSGKDPPGPQQIKPQQADEATEQLRRFRETLLTRVAEALVSEMLPRYDYR